MTSGHVDLVSTPPSPAWPMMSGSGQLIAAATLRRAARSICRRPPNVVCRSDRTTGTQFAGSLVSHTTPLANGWSLSWPYLSVGT